jgi:hypothetical protein
MFVKFAFPEFDLRDKEEVEEVTKRIGLFTVRDNDKREQKELKQLLNQQPELNIHHEIKMYIVRLLMNYMTWLLSQKSADKLEEISSIEEIIALLEEGDKENGRNMSLACIVNSMETFCYIQVYTESRNLEIMFQIDAKTRNVEYIQIFENNFPLKISLFGLQVQKWIENLSKKSSGLLQKPKSGDISDLLVKDDHELKNGLNDEGGGVPVPAHDDLQDNDLPLVFESEAPAYSSISYDKKENYYFWQSWAQWVFMFQDHKTVNEACKKIFMQYFMNLVAKELFNLSGEVSYVKRHKDIHKTKDLGIVTKVHTGDRIEAHHDIGKILVLYRNLPHGESPGDYDKLIRETGKHMDTLFLYIGEGADLAYCEKLESLEKLTTEFYGHATTGHSGSRSAAETGEGNAGTKNLMVGGSDEEDGKSAEDRIKEIEKEYREVEAGLLLQDNWRVHLAKKKAEKRRTEKAKEKLEERKRFEEQKTVWRDFKKKAIEENKTERRIKEEKRKWEEERKKMEEERTKGVHADSHIGSLLLDDDDGDDDLR